jgi:DNA-binding NarL/FixJ family response regulator
MSAPITVLIVDDHAVVRHGARAYLEAQLDIQVVGAVGSGAEGVLAAAAHRGGAHPEYQASRCPRPPHLG